MNIVGLDFGTTNSILSFYSDKTKSIVSWKMGGVDGISYIPSFLSIEDGDIYIGNTAKENVLYGDNIESYSKFKILLAETDKSKLSKNGFKLKSPKDISALYIKKLLDTYKEEQNIKQIDKIVVSIPEIWIKDNLDARNELKSILEDLDLPNIDLKSEPVSAGAYFLHRYKENHNKNFNGNFLIFDFGGGTLDITLLESNNDKLKILERTGKGNSNDFIGKAGVAFDNLVIKKAIQKQYNENLKDDDKVFLSLLVEFEKRKISKTEKIKKDIEKYFKMKKDTSIFMVEKKKYELEITPSLLVESFNELFKEDINKSLEEIRKSFDFYNIDDKNDEKFKIVLVGGFSSFYLSQKAVMNFFGTRTLSDKRFEQDFTKDDLSLSISKGTALLAKNIVKEEQTYPMSLGIILYSPSLERFEEIVLKKGNTIVKNKTKYISQNITGKGVPNLFFDNGSKKGILKLNHDIDKLFPNSNRPDNLWNIGFSMDKNNFYFLHIKDKLGKENKIEFSYLVKEFEEAIVVESKLEKDDKLLKQIEKLELKLDEAKSLKDIEDKINTFNNTLDPILSDMINYIAKRNNIKVSEKINFFEDIKILEENINDELLSKLHKVRIFRNNHSHQKNAQLENMSENQRNALLSEMTSIVSDIKLIKEHFNI